MRFAKDVADEVISIGLLRSITFPWSIKRKHVISHNYRFVRDVYKHEFS